MHLKGILFSFQKSSQFNFASIPHFIQKILQISLTPQTWPPTSPFARSSHSAHPLQLWNECFGNLSSKVWQGCSNQMLHFPAASKCRLFIMCSCLCVHIHTIANTHFKACPQTWMVSPSQTKVTPAQQNNLTESKKVTSEMQKSNNLNIAKCSS